MSARILFNAIRVRFYIKDLLIDNSEAMLTRKWTLHVRVSYSTVCNTTVSTKKTRRTLMKQVRKLRVKPHVCEGNAPVSVKKNYVFVQAIKRGRGHGHRCMCVSSSTKSPLDKCVCVRVCVMEAFLEVVQEASPR